MKRISLYITGVIQLLLLTACANPGSGPDGGPYDETPPRIVRMTPEIGAKGQQTKKVTISFDEAIKVENAQEKVTISPPQIEMPEIKTSGRHISVELIDSLLPATTYTIDFSDAIVDMTEGNPLGNFTYYFSTGEAVDTMEVAGYVLSADNLEPMKGVNVGLHRSLEDSAFTTKAFDRVGRTDGNGHFTIKGVAPGEYRIYALKDMDGDFRYSRGETLAFSRDTIRPSQFADIRHDTLWADTVHIDTIRQIPFTHYMPDDVVLLAFTETNTTRALLKTQREPHYFRLYFTAPSNHEPEVRALNFPEDGAWLKQRSLRGDTLTYWLRDSALVNQDSLRITLTYMATNDSTGVDELQTDTLDLIPKIPLARRQKLAEAEIEKWQKGLEKRHKRGDFSQEKMPREPLTVRYSARSAMTPDRNVTIEFDEPVSRFDTTGVHLYLKVDTIYREVPFRLRQDSLNMLSYTLKAEWRPGQEYVLNVDSASIEGLLGKVNNPYDAKFRITPNEEVGAIFLLIPDADSTAIVQLLTAGEKVSKQLPVKDGHVDFFYLEPGTYYVRLFFDRNGDGRRTEGCFAEGRQSEEVYYFPEEFVVRANWDIEQTWHLDAVPRYRQKPRILVKQKDEQKRTPKSRNAEREREKRGQ